MTGVEALDVWEHIAFSEWMGKHELPADDIREECAFRAFEDEYCYWESCVFRGPSEEAASLDSSAFDEDDSHLYECDSSEDFY
jgi:hypothetical protein